MDTPSALACTYFVDCPEIAFNPTTTIIAISNSLPVLHQHIATHTKQQLSSLFEETYFGPAFTEIADFIRNIDDQIDTIDSFADRVNWYGESTGYSITFTTTDTSYCLAVIIDDAYHFFTFVIGQGQTQSQSN